MTEVSKYVDSNGNFTHTKFEGTHEDIIIFIKNYKKSKFYQEMTNKQKFLTHMYVFHELLTTGMFPSKLLLELVMPASEKRLPSLKTGDSITIECPQRYKKDDKVT